MKGKMITSKIIEQFEKHLRMAEKSDNTIEKYIRDVKIGVTPYLLDPRCSSQRIIDCMNISNSKLLVSFMDIIGDKVKPELIPCDTIIAVSVAGDLDGFLRLGNEAKAVKFLYKFKENQFKRNHKKNNKIILNNEFLICGKNYNGVIDSDYDPDIPAAIMNTSGTTGTPKGAMESNRAYNITANQVTYIAPNLKKRRVTNYGYIPFFSLYGSSTGMHTAISVGANIDIIPKADLVHFDKIFATKKPNVVIGVPKLFSGFKDSEHLKNLDLSFTELYAIGGDKIAPNKLAEIEKFFKDRGCKYGATYGYGSTETMMIATMSNN